MSEIIASSPAASKPSSPTSTKDLNASALKVQIPGKSANGAGLKSSHREYVADSLGHALNFRPQGNVRQGPYSAVPAAEGQNNGLWSPSLGQLISQTNVSLAFLVPTTPRHEPGQTPTSPSAKLSRHNSSRRLNTTNKSLSPREIGSRQAARRHKAQMKRAIRVQERKMRAATRESWTKHKKNLVEQTFQLKQLRTKLRTDSYQASAHIRRQMIIQSRVENLGRQGQYVLSVSMLTKLRRAVNLRRSVSTSFLDALYEASGNEPEEEVAELDEADYEAQLLDAEYEDIMANFESLLALPSDLGMEYEAGSVVSPTGESSFTLTKSMSVPELLAKTESQPIISIQLVFGKKLPPITRFTLQELDVDFALSNWQTRHDLVFDPDLRFKPNEAGTRGAAVRELRDEFWRGITLDDTDKILILINEAKAIICDLITWPDNRVQEFDDAVDIALIEQQIKQKTYNPAGTLCLFVGWIKEICAPVRDADCDAISELINQGQFLPALQQLFSTMENLKLDIVNNSMRKLRPWVVHEAPHFELREFNKAVENGQLSLMKTTYWLCNELPKCKEANPSYSARQIFYTCYVDLVRTFSTQESALLPETFELDRSRIRAFYSSWEDLAILANVLMIFRQALGPRAAVTDTTKARDRLKILLEDKDSCLDNVHLEMTRVAGDLRGKPFTDRETEQLGAMLQKTLTAGNPVYELILTRVGLHLAHRIRAGRFDEELLAKHNMMDLLPNLEPLGERMKFLADHNLAIFEDIYANIAKQIFSTDPLDDETEPMGENEGEPSE